MVEQGRLMTLVEDLARELLDRRWLCTTVESCTGGGIARALTELPGSSGWFERGFVTYSNDSKRELVDVSADDIDRCGAVSEEVARQMAEGALRHSAAQVAIAVTGIAGPSGGTPDKPVGTVAFAWGLRDRGTTTRTRTLDGDREDIRTVAVEQAIEGMLVRLRQEP